MYFLEQQQAARRLSRVFIWQFALACLLCLSAVFLVTLLCVAPIANALLFIAIDKLAPDATILHAPVTSPEFLLLWFGSAGFYSLVITAVGIWKRTRILRNGHDYFQQELDARQIHPGDTHPDMKRLLNIGTEMSLASGMPAPRVYVWPTRVAVNSFTVGTSSSDSSIFISRGAVRALKRDELQALVGYGVSQILNGDTALNTRMAAYLGAMRWPGRAALKMVFLPFEPRNSVKDRVNTVFIWILFGLWLGLVLSALSLPQYLAARWLQRRVARERQRLNDATALQFTRDGFAYVNALVTASAVNISERMSSIFDDLEQLDDYTDAFQYGAARMAEVFINDLFAPRMPHGNRTLAHSGPSVQVALSVIAQFTAKQQAREAFAAGLKRIGMSRQLDYAPQLRWSAPLDRALKTLDRLMPIEKQAFLEGCRTIIEFDRVQSPSERELLRVIAYQLHCSVPRAAQIKG